MRLPRIFRTTPFRLTLLFLALFASAASAFLAYIYVATAGEATLSASWPGRGAASAARIVTRACFRVCFRIFLSSTPVDRAQSFAPT